MVSFDLVLHVLEALGVRAYGVFGHSAASCGEHAESDYDPIVACGGIVVESSEVVLKLAAEVVGELGEHDSIHSRAAWF